MLAVVVFPSPGGHCGDFSTLTSSLLLFFLSFRFQRFFVLVRSCTLEEMTVNKKRIVKDIGYLSGFNKDTF